MKDTNTIASYYSLTEHFYDIDTNDQGEVISLELFDGDYEDFPCSDEVLQFVSHFKHLKRLHIDIYDCVISSLSPIEDLHHLEVLHLECRTTLSDLEFVYHFPKLTDINIDSSKISDLTPLIGCKHLISIRITNANISEISCLEQLPGLTGLYFSKNAISNIDVLKHLKNLVGINFFHNQISNIDVLENHTQLKYVILSWNAIEDISALKSSNQIINLRLDNNKIGELKGIKYKTKLRHLDIANNQIKDVSKLKGKTTLEFLSISGNPIESLEPIYDLPDIKNLYASGLNIKTQEEWRPFASKITYLDLSHNRLKDAGFLENQNVLLQVNLSYNALTKADWVTSLSKLRHINLAYNAFQTPFPIYALYGTDAVDLRHNPFGNRLFERYKGCASHASIYEPLKEEESALLIRDLEKEVADFYMKHQNRDSALAYYYTGYERQSETTLNLYLKKLLDTPKDDVVYLKYYFYRMVIASPKAFAIPAVGNNIYLQVKTCFDAISDKAQRLHLLKLLEWVKDGHLPMPSTIFNPLEFFFYERKHSNPYFTDEILYFKGMGFATGQIKREHLDRGVFYLKTLYDRESPFFYTLKRHILETLDKHFAYTESERKAHDDYMDIINRINQVVLEEPKQEGLDIAIGVEIKQGYKFVYYDVDLVRQLNIPTAYNTESKTSNRMETNDLLKYILWGVFILILVERALRFW